MQLRAFLISLALSGAAMAAPKAPLLPANFAGWHLTEAKTGVDAAGVDAANAALLKEYGLAEFENATYERSGQKLKLRAVRFADAGGAFGAFTFYSQPKMQGESIGDRAATSGDHVLFQRANFLVDALFEHPTAMSGGELRELAQELPVAKGSSAALPEIVGYLPTQNLVPNSLRFAQGPVTLAAIGSSVPAKIVDFSRSAEVAAGEYRTRWGTATLAAVSYPTPQIALEYERALISFVEPANKQAGVHGTVIIPTSDGGQVAFRRSGPLLIYVSGTATEQEARNLAQSVNYEASVTWNQPPQVTVNGVVNLVVYSLILALMLIAIFLVIMIFLGGSYVAVRKFFPNFKLPAQDRELIKLNLKD